jgi:hypothetical protein
MELNTENEQTLISKKKTSNAFSVNRKLINSKKFRDKFELLPITQEAKNRVYQEVGRLLEFVDGSENEYLVALDYYDGHRIIDNFKREGQPRSTGFTSEEYEHVLQNDAEIIVVHNHSYNGRPSAKDLITFHDNDRIRLSIVACHNGELYVIFNVSDDMISVYNDLLKGEKEIVNDTDLAKRLVMTRLYDFNEKISPKRKLFDVRRL